MTDFNNPKVTILMSEWENQSVGPHEKEGIVIVALNKNYRSGPWPGKGCEPLPTAGVQQ